MCAGHAFDVQLVIFSRDVLKIFLFSATTLFQYRSRYAKFGSTLETAVKTIL